MVTGCHVNWEEVLVCPPHTGSAGKLPLSEGQMQVVLVVKDTSQMTDINAFLEVVSAIPGTWQAMVLISSADAPWTQLPALKLPVYWTTLAWNSPAKVYILHGTETLHRFSTVPADLSPYFKPSTCTLAELGHKISTGDSEALISTYCDIRSQEVYMNHQAMHRLLSLLGKRLGIDLHPAVNWFETHKNPIGEDDILHTHDVSFKEFTRRLLSYCRYMTEQQEKPVSRDSQYQTSVWQSKLSTLESQVQLLRSELLLKENAIQRLQQELRKAENTDKLNSGSLHNSPASRTRRVLELSEEELKNKGEPAASMLMMHRPVAGAHKKSPKLAPGKAKQMRKWDSQHPSAKYSPGS